MNKLFKNRSADAETDHTDEALMESNADALPVGYTRPPVETRFRKGRSGNPKGRPKGSESLSKVFQEVSAERISVTQGGKVRRMSKAQALVHLTMAQAIKGDVKAIDGMLLFADRIGRLDMPNDDGETKLPVILVPEKISDDEEWERLYGADARGEKHLNHDQPQPRKVTRPFSIEAGDVLATECEFDEALACYRRNLAMCQVRIARNGIDAELQNSLHLAVVRIAYVSLQFIGKGQLAKAIDTLDQAIDLEPTEMRWQRFRALALMLYGNVHQAEAIYIEHSNDEAWKADTLIDFKGARDCGYTHPLMDKIEKLFTADGSGQTG
ncbi:MAG: DUF5681 domain-containing protein [Pseudolabrys sp.]|nr:DUF5681 domain-containing protein [Pseudolabrys sp.]MDP2296991.1 DUF5681 domain-containing protein [Pseudolabrys sp.]